MGVSTDAILAYGFDLGEGDDGESSWMEKLASEQPQDGDEVAAFEFDEWVGRSFKESDYSDFDAYYNARRDAINACPFDLIMHQSYDYPAYFLAVRGTEQRASRGYPSEISTDKEITLSAVATMRLFCITYGIEWKEPQWHIFSMWG